MKTDSSSPVNTRKTTLQQLAWILLVVLLTFAIRSTRPELVRFGNDQSSHYDVLRRMAGQGEMPLIGPPVGFSRASLGPFHYYLYLPGYLLDPRPEGILRTSAVFHAMTAGLLATLAPGVFPFPVRLAAALLFAVSPDMVYLARDFWSLTSLPLFVMLYLHLLLAYGRKRRAITGGLAMLLAGLISQLHIVGALLVLPVLALAWNRHRLAVPVFGGALALLSYLPWWIFQLTHGLQDLLAYAELLGRAGAGGGGGLNLAALKLFFTWPGWFFNYVHTYDSHFFQGNLFWGPVGFTTLLFFLGILRTTRAAFRSPDAERKRSGRLFLMVLLLPLALLLLLPWTVYERHLLVIFPLPFLVVADTLNWILPVRGRRWMFPLLVTVFLGIPWFLADFEFYRQVDRTASIQGELPLRDKRSVLDFADRFLGKAGADRVIGRIHPLGTADTAMDYRTLARLEGAEDDNQPPLGPEQMIYFRDSDRLRLGDPRALRHERSGPLHMLELESRIREDSVQITRGGMPADWQPLAGLPLVEADDLRAFSLRGEIRLPRDRAGMIFSVFTNLQIQSFRMAGRPLPPLENVLSQTATTEVQARERLFRIDEWTDTGGTTFEISFARPTRWYMVDLVAWTTGKSERIHDLARGTDPVAVSSSGVRWLKLPGAGWQYFLPDAESWFYLQYPLGSVAGWDVDSLLHLRISSGGPGGLLRVQLREANGEIWVHDNYELLSCPGEVSMVFPLALLRKADWGPQGDGALDLEQFRQLEIGVHPYLESLKTQEIQVLQLGVSKLAE